MFVGTHNAATNVFTVSIAGADTLFVADQDSEAATGIYDGLVLASYVDDMQNDSWSAAGTLTSVAG